MVLQGGLIITETHGAGSVPQARAVGVDPTAVGGMADLSLRSSRHVQSDKWVDHLCIPEDVRQWELGTAGMVLAIANNGYAS